MTFDDFMWQVRCFNLASWLASELSPQQQLRRPVDISPKTVVTYAIRFIFCFLTMEFIQHYIYVVAIKEAVAWRGDSPLELSMVGFWNLIHVWLKVWV
jgi:D-alanyl-lipoteichoic acid acyltransferase DltB (MBOAT superfamily)